MKNVVRQVAPVTTFLVLMGAALPRCGGKSTHSDKDNGATAAPLNCEDDSAVGVGSWTKVLQPDELLGPARLSADLAFTAGDEFFLADGTFIASLSPDGESWQTTKANAPLKISGDTFVGSPDYLLVQGGRDETRTLDTDSSPLVQVLNLTSDEWSDYTPPDAFGARSLLSVVWTGEEFLLWGGYSVAPESGKLEAHTDGKFLNPVTGAWRSLKGAAPPLEYGVDEIAEHLGGLVASVWTEKGLFVLGSEPKGDRLRAHLLSRELEQWSELTMEGGPSLRKWHRLVAANDSVYVVGGTRRGASGDEPRLRELYRYSLSESTWSQVDIPDFVYPGEGLWHDGKLYLFGTCRHHSVYDPAEMKWSRLAPLDAVGGVPYTAGNRIVMMHVPENSWFSNYAYVFTPDSSIGAGGGSP